MRLGVRLNRKLHRYLTERTDGRPFVEPNYLRQACRVLALYVRLAERAARREPHLYGPHAEQYRQDTAKQAEWDAVCASALEKVYGPRPPGAPPSRPDAWTYRYEILPKWPKFLRWFREKYGS
jgi:hypothetical protein